MISQEGRDAALAILDLSSANEDARRRGAQQLLELITPSAIVDGHVHWHLDSLVEGVQATVWAAIHGMAEGFGWTVPEALASIREDLDGYALPEDPGDLLEVWARQGK